MNYNDKMGEYDRFMRAVKDKHFLITELELRKGVSTNVLISVMGTGKMWNYTDEYPVEVFMNYEIVIEYVVADAIKNGKVNYLSECIAFDEGVKLDVVMPVYEELLKRRVQK